MKRFILIGIAMSLLNFTIQAEVVISFDGHTLTASTDQVGVPGLRGCGMETATQIAGYIFELQSIKTAGNSCDVGNRKGWRTIAKKATNEPSAVFNNLESGTYRVLCKVGKPIGCVIKNAPSQFPNKSIVYEIEKSESTDKNINDVAAKTNDFAAEALELFPNPSAGNVQIELRNHELKGPVRLVLYDVLGKEIFTKKLSVGNALSQQWKLDLEHLAEGAYFIKIADDMGHSYSGKIVRHKK